MMNSPIQVGCSIDNFCPHACTHAARWASVVHAHPHCCQREVSCRVLLQHSWAALGCPAQGAYTGRQHTFPAAQLHPQGRADFAPQEANTLHAGSWEPPAPAWQQLHAAASQETRSQPDKEALAQPVPCVQVPQVFKSHALAVCQLSWVMRRGQWKIHRRCGAHPCSSTAHWSMQTARRVSCRPMRSSACSRERRPDQAA
jgi:hypothetical protein